jgi:integrase/recombinase XerD
LRRGEGARLTAKDIDCNRCTPFARQSKNRKDRIIPLSENVCNAIQDYTYNFRNFVKCGHDRLFIRHPNRAGDYPLHLQRISPDDGIQSKRLSFRVLRHSIAACPLQNGMTMEYIARFLGHSDIRAAQIIARRRSIPFHCLCNRFF